MTHICYNLEESAQKVGVSETVLVRLSQYFKVPQIAYEEKGYLSFKGDLMFTDGDISFFQQVRERLLEGESLEEVKKRLRYNASQPQAVQASQQSTQRPAGPQAVVQQYAPAQRPGPTTIPRSDASPLDLSGEAFMTPPREALKDLLEEDGWIEDKWTEVPPLQKTASALPAKKPAPERTPETPPQKDFPLSETAPPETELAEIENDAVYEKVAQASFERYKGLNQSNTRKVFRNMVREVGESRKAANRFPVFKPLKSKVSEEKPGSDRPESFQQKHPNNHFKPTMPPVFKETEKRQASVSEPKPVDFDWERLIAPNPLSPQPLAGPLRQAALVLKQDALRRREEDRQRRSGHA